LYCRSLVINSYFCDHGPLFRLAAPVLMWSLGIAMSKINPCHILPAHYFYALLYTIIPTNARIINLSLTSILPPMLNPIVYVLKTEEFKVSVKKMLRRGAQIAVPQVKPT
ncbi:olfactory receptor 4D9-like, partial [Oncorhynchus nerka]|uniref:olfactory receptor 4D9-like n=1 Tax=Oncorhynchus nerka TaxID=8023 RepID=UPI0031B825D9